MLHGLPEYQTDEIPTCALLMSSVSRPVAYNIACEAPCDLGWVIVAEVLLRPFSFKLHDTAVAESGRLEEVRQYEIYSSSWVTAVGSAYAADFNAPLRFIIEGERLEGLRHSRDNIIVTGHGTLMSQ